ncbi:hypothetical protein M0R45_005411 [Rubus argutus]|uniref:Uncharacterized protein n=1 Tax=Rubus argutus TaxID=59490 RepID=A0AAW1YMM2_RUBAR
MALFPVGKWRTIAAAIAPLPQFQSRSFRSDAALEALAKASQEKVPNLLLYNYPSFSGRFLRSLRSRLLLSPQPPLPLSPFLLSRTLQGR